MKKENGYYSEEFKWHVVQQIISGEYGKEEARRIYGIKSNCAILYWMRKFSGNDDYRAGGDPLSNPLAMSKSKNEKALETRIKELEETLKRERLRADLWQKMVQVAEEDLKINIRKKSGAKQS